MDGIDAIRLHVNGKAYVVDKPELGVNLSTWLRSSAGLTGTKVMCAEGGCGACVVTVSRTDPRTGQERSFAANSCLFPLLSADGCHITTTEGLIEDGGQYNAIQERVAHFNATQCGYCTPGFVMTMHSLLQRNPQPTQAEIEAEFDGNLCRCTGYRPIFDAMKSFASDADIKLTEACADIEDLKICRQNCKNSDGHCYKSCGRYEADGKLELVHKAKASTLMKGKPHTRNHSRAKATASDARLPNSISPVVTAQKDATDELQPEISALKHMLPTTEPFVNRIFQFLSNWLFCCDICRLLQSALDPTQDEAEPKIDGKSAQRSSMRDDSGNSRSDAEPELRKMLIKHPGLHFELADESAVWVRPSTLDELTDQVKEYIFRGKLKIRFVVGNTSTGIFKNEGTFDVYIDTKNVKELYEIADSKKILTLGTNVSLSDLIDEFENRSIESETFAVMAKHIKKVAHGPVRNVACWAGNIMVKKLHPEFPSDIFVLFAAFNVTITVLDCMTGQKKNYNLTGRNNFMELDMTGKVIVGCRIPKAMAPSGGQFKALSYKVMPRSQNAHAYVNAAFFAVIVNGIVTNASITFGGISKGFARARQTEYYLTGKDVNSQVVLNGALKALDTEVQPVSYSSVNSSPKYRKSLTLGLFYKFYLYICNGLPAKIASAIATLERPVTSSTRTYDSEASMFPVTEPIPKITAIKQASGEAIYLTDNIDLADELHATYVMAEIGNADIDVIDSSYAETMPGFHSIITASDFPPSIRNTFVSPPLNPLVILADGHVDFAGQPVALVLADSKFHAEEIAKAVSVTYKNSRHVVCDLEEAIERKMIFDGGDHLERGDAESAMKNAKVKISGRAKIGSQYHFYMETQIARAKPTEDGFDVRCATQWQDGVQSSCAYILGWDSNRIKVHTERIGGAYGGKAMNSRLTASLAVVASYISGRPVRFHSSLARCMETYGKRANYIIEYQVGTDNDGILEAIEATYYANTGVAPNDPEFAAGAIAQFVDGGYYCPNWKLSAKNVRTDTASTTWCRAPVAFNVSTRHSSSELMIFLDMMMEHVASAVKQDPIVIKQRNLYKVGQIDLAGKHLTHLKLRDIAKDLVTSTNATQRQQEIDKFNKENRWKKRGLGFTPLKFGVTWAGGNYATQVSIYASDGSVILSAGAVDSGQGISTKLAQVASYVLGVPMDFIRLSVPSNVTTPNCAPTGSSFSSEICSQGILKCCQTLKSRLDAAAAKLKLPGNISWKDKVAKCYADGVDLTASDWIYPEGASLKQYDVCGAGISEVEMDILTGEFALRKVDIMYDCGNSVNPEIDVCQAEGAFIFGLGYLTTEKLTYDPQSGRLLNHNTWDYKPPCSKDIPTEWKITFVKDKLNPRKTLSSKVVGEPPLLLSSSVVFAIKRCVESFRDDGLYFPIDTPATVDNIQQLCAIKLSDYTLRN